VRTRGRIPVGFILAGSVTLAACGRSELGDVEPSAPPDAGAPAPMCPVDLSGCQGRQCQATIDACDCHHAPLTTISGTVYDPAGRLPLYGVYVYIPTVSPDPIVPGSPTCTPCAAPASGTPIVGAFTDAHGHFTLQQNPGDAWGVPSGNAVPLVLQIGKWRRQITIPHVEACAANELPDPPVPSLKLRLPGRTSEGDMPRIAFTSGCDPAECFLRSIGIDDSEFVTPDSPTGHVHFYTGRSGTGSSLNTGSAVMGGDTPDQTYDWWQSLDNLMAYDVVFNSCECEAFTRGASAYQAIHDYLSSGGRVFADHFFHNWFEPPSGSPDLQAVGNWVLPDTDEKAQVYAKYFVDTSHPKGQAFADWLDGVQGTVAPAEVSVRDPRYAENETPPLATRWVYNADQSDSAKYASIMSTFDAPVGASPGAQCGRAVLNEMHIVSTSDASDFPIECLDTNTVEDFTEEEKLTEFLFFDLMSCVQDESAPPAPITPR
jgi:hypothetical protein